MPNIRQAQDDTIQAGHDALDTLDERATQARTAIPEAFNRAAAQVQELTKRGMERARAVTDTVKDQAVRAGDQTTGFIKDEPLKSVLIAAAAGATVALVLRWLSSRRI